MLCQQLPVWGIFKLCFLELSGMPSTLPLSICNPGLVESTDVTPSVWNTLYTLYEVICVTYSMMNYPLLVAVWSLSCVQLFCNLMDCSPPGSSVRGIFQAGILEWVAISFSRGSSQPRDQTQVSCIGRQILYY